MKSTLKDAAPGPCPDPDALLLKDMSCDPPARFYEGKPDLPKRRFWRSLALRVLSPLLSLFVDLPLDCFTAVLAKPDETPGREVSTFAELAQAMIFEDLAAVPEAPHPPALSPAVGEDVSMEGAGAVLANTSPAVEWMSPPL